MDMSLNVIYTTKKTSNIKRAVRLTVLFEYMKGLKMDYSFIRKVVQNIKKEDAEKIFNTCVANGVEVFIEKDNAFQNASLETVTEHVDLYVSAADFEFAKELVEGLNLTVYLCNDLESVENIKKTDIELAEEEFYRKHKQNQMFAWGVILLVILFLAFQFIKG